MSVTDSLPLIDHHCHGVVTADITADEVRALATESDWLSDPGIETLDSPFGLAIRARCAPLLDLAAHAPIDDYLARRVDLGAAEVNRRLMAAAGVGQFVVDTGYKSDAVATPEQMSSLFGAPAVEIVRLEAVAEALGPSTTASTFAADFGTAIAAASVDAVGFKSIIAYRYGLDVTAAPPSAADVAAAAGEWLAAGEATGSYRVSDPVLLSYLAWSVVGLGKPIQFHVGFGDSDLTLHRADPSLLSDFIRATRTSGTAIMLLHCYPFVRQAGSLAHIFPHVYLDVGEVSHYLGVSTGTAIAEALELAPFTKVLFSSDAYGLSEHYAVSTTLWRRYTGALLDRWIADDAVSIADAERIAVAVASGNAARVYGLDTL